MNKQKNKDIVEINFRGFFKVIKKRKIAFIVAFCVILLVGLVYTFITAPEYSSVSQVSLSNNEFYYSGAFYKYLPKEADSLFILPEYDKDKELFYISDKLDTFSEDIKSVEVLENVSNKLEGKVTEKEVAESINVVLDRWSGKIIFTTYSDNPELAFQLNHNLLDEYIKLKNAELLESYNRALLSINNEIEETEQSLKLLLVGTESDEDIDLILDTAMEEETEKLAALNTIRENLVDSRDYFTSRIEIIQSPDIDEIKNTSSYFRNILLSIVAAILAGIISAFVVNYFRTPGKKS